MIPVNEPYRVTSKFGEKRDIPPWGVHYHDGVDLVSSQNRNVYCAATGVVIADRDDYDHAKRWTDKKDSVGNRILMQCVVGGKTYYAAYYHIINNYVKEGQTIEAGKIIGLYDDVGMSYGAHLHFMVWNDKWKVVDPKILLEV